MRPFVLATVGLSLLVSCLSVLPTITQMMAIGKVQSIFERYNRHRGARDEIIQIIRRTDTNLEVIIELAQFAASQGSNTQVYVDLARYAARAEYASDEFVLLARRIDLRSTRSSWESIARALAEARSPGAVRRIRRNSL